VPTLSHGYPPGNKPLSWSTETGTTYKSSIWRGTATLLGLRLERAGAEFAAAAAVLGENQVLTENPAALSMVGVGLSNAGRALSDLAAKAAKLAAKAAISPADEAAFYGEVGMVLSGVAGDMASAAVATGTTCVADAEQALSSAADALEDLGVAYETLGCGCGGDGGFEYLNVHILKVRQALIDAAGAVDAAAASMAAAAARDSPSAAAARNLAAAAEGLNCKLFRRGSPIAPEEA
jgi:hypothetical protein